MCQEILCDNKTLLRYVEGYSKAGSEVAQSDDDKDRWKYLHQKIKAHLGKIAPAPVTP